MLLAAGSGTRLRPLTDLLPKPLMPVGLRPLLDRHLDALAAIGVERVAVNASHRADELEAHLRDAGARQPRVTLLREESPLGLGGGLLGARPLLGRESRFLAVNADVFHAVDLPAAIASHERREADATLVLRRARGSEAADELAVNREGDVTSLPGMGRSEGWRFTGIQVLTPALFDHLSSPGALFDGYRGLLESGGRIGAHDCGDAMWIDIGTVERYLLANRAAAVLRTDGPRRTGPGISGDALVAANARIGRNCLIEAGTVIGEEAAIGDRARLFDTVVWPGMSVAPGSLLRSAVVYPGGLLIAGGRDGEGLRSSRPPRRPVPRSAPP
jgi:mannose-1-phosphate guanylyltransferase